MEILMEPSGAEITPVPPEEEDDEQPEHHEIPRETLARDDSGAQENELACRLYAETD